MRSHEDLKVWQESIQFVTQIYEITKNFPKSELYGIVSQIRRSAISIPSNIAEGAGRNHKKEYIQFCYISLGSLAELETQIIIASNLKYIENKTLKQFTTIIRHIRSMLSGLIKSLKNQGK